MADPRVPFLETLRKAALASDEDLLRELVEDDGRIDLQEAVAIAGAIVSGVMRLRA
jgi:hypothetical protein